MSTPRGSRRPATSAEPYRVEALPPGFRVRLRPEVEQLDAGKVLIGGSPLRAMRLATTLAGQVHGRDIIVDGPTSEALARRLLDGNLADPVLEHRVSPDQVTVVIPVHNRPEQLDRTLTHIRGVPTIVVDDASEDPGATRAVTARHGATLIQLPANAGPASARNTGLRLVTTPFVAFVDSDVEVTPDALCSLAAHLSDPKVALVGPRIHGVARSGHPRWFERFDAEASSLALGSRPCSVRPGSAVGWLPGACMLGRTAVLNSSPILGFNVDMRVGEDVDLVWRLVAQGHSVRYDPTILALHDARTTVREWLGRKVFYGTGSAQLASRHGDAIAPAILSPAMGLAALALLLRHRAAGPVAVAAIAWGARRVGPALGEVDGRTRVAVRLAARGLGWSLRQESALVLRHWWPATFVACVFSRHARRITVSALAVDAVVAATVDRRDLDVPTAWLGRRLDDLAYGAGLWLGALRSRSTQVLRIRVLGHRAAPRRSTHSSMAGTFHDTRQNPA